ncbi:MAG: TolC family outer membrane protein [Piscinibacter sp.]|nr:TolC family outer membrane protein [Piscinibacter sp.]
MSKMFLAGLSLALLSGPSLALDLMDSYRKAREADPDLLAAHQALAAGREKAVQGSALLKPQIGLTASVSHANDRSSTGNLPPQLAGLVPDSSSGSTHQVALQLKQPLYDAKARADKAQLEQQTGLAEVSHRQAEQSLIQRVGEAYFDVLLAQESLRVVQAEKAAVGLQRDRAQARFDVGRGKITDLQEAQARYDGVLTREVSAQSTLALRQAQYRELTGVEAEGLAPLAAGFVPAPPAPDSLAAWQLKGEDANTRVQRQRGELAIAGAEIEKYRLSGRPTLDLVASVTDRGQHGGSSSLSPERNRSALIGLQFNLPLYAGGGIDSRERESLARQRQAEQQLAGARRDTRLQVQDGFLAVKTGVARIASLEQSLRSTRTALEATTLGRDVGTRTELDVLDAQQRVFASELDLAQARHDYLLGRLRLAAAAGELQEGDLQSLNAQLTR